jgi:hypothetical protein
MGAFSASEGKCGSRMARTTHPFAVGLRKDGPPDSGAGGHGLPSFAAAGTGLRASGRRRPMRPWGPTA